MEISVNFLLRAEGRRGCFPCASGLGRAARVLTAVCRAHAELRLKCKRTDRTGTDRTQLKRVRACSSSLASAWVTRCGRYSTLSRPLDAPRAPLTQRRRSDARRRHPRLRRRELEAARATARSRLDQVRPATAHPLPPFEHQPADAQATATHRARAAPPQEPARAQQRPRSTPSRSTTSPRCCWEPARGRSRRRASPPTATRARSDAAQPPYTAKVARVVRVRVGRPP